MAETGIGAGFGSDRIGPKQAPRRKREEDRRVEIVQTIRDRIPSACARDVSRRVSGSFRERSVSFCRPSFSVSAAPFSKNFSRDSAAGCQPTCSVPGRRSSRAPKPDIPAAPITSSKPIFSSFLCRDRELSFIHLFPQQTREFLASHLVIFRCPRSWIIVHQKLARPAGFGNRGIHPDPISRQSPQGTPSRRRSSADGDPQ